MTDTEKLDFIIGLLGDLAEAQDTFKEEVTEQIADVEEKLANLDLPGRNYDIDGE